MIHLKNINLSYIDQTLFNDISAHFSSNQHIGVVGRNGVGKSTLLKAIAGSTMLDSGSIAVEKKKTIAFMPQEIVLTSTKSIFDEAFSSFDQLYTLQHERVALEELFEQDTATEKDIERYSELLSTLSEHNIEKAKIRTNEILTGLGFAQKTMDQPVSNLSVGWKMRVILAKLLLTKADFYLFDEPTNHLDMVSKEWFLDFLKEVPSGFLLVTHDRYFLEHACDYIFELERGNGRLFNGNFSTYLELKEHERTLKEATRTQQLKERARKQKTIDRFRASATKAKMVQNMIRQLESEEVVELDPVLPTIRFQFPEPVRAGNTALSFKHLSKTFDGRTIFNTIDGSIMRGDKAALIAPNGAGKTTLFNLIIGNYSCPKGTVTFGHNVTYATFEQDQAISLIPSNTVFQEVKNGAPGVSEARIRKFLGSFLFSGDDVHKKIQVLSGGERNRVALVKLLLQDANLLILDEPTNHLDIYAKEVLLQALQQFQGTIFIVSHDHSFLERLVTRVFELTPNRLLDFPGSYESYLYAKKTDEKENKATAQSKEKPQATLPKHPPKQSTKELRKLERAIQKEEKAIKLLEEQFAHLTYNSEEYQQANKKLKERHTELKQLYATWEKIVP